MRAKAFPPPSATANRFPFSLIEVGDIPGLIFPPPLLFLSLPSRAGSRAQDSRLRPFLHFRAHDDLEGDAAHLAPFSFFPLQSREKSRSWGSLPDQNRKRKPTSGFFPPFFFFLIDQGNISSGFSFFPPCDRSVTMWARRKQRPFFSFCDWRQLFFVLRLENRKRLSPPFPFFAPLP